MIDTNLIKDDPKAVVKNLELRNYIFDIEGYEGLEVNRKKFQTETEDLQSQRNYLSKEYGLLIKDGKADPTLNLSLIHI